MTFVRLGKRAEAKPDETILDVARRASAPIGNSCGGVGVCARCIVRIVEGAENLSPPTTMEAQRAMPESERLACQAVVKGDVKVTTTYW